MKIFRYRKHRTIMLVLGNKTEKIFVVSNRPSEKQMTVTLSDSFERHRNFSIETAWSFNNTSDKDY